MPTSAISEQKGSDQLDIQLNLEEVEWVIHCLGGPLFDSLALKRLN